MLEKCKRDGTDINLAFLNQINTPRDEVLGSPAQRMMARRLKSTLPCAEDVQKPKPFDGVVIKHRLSEKRQQQKKYYHKQAKYLPTLKKGDVIRMQTNNGNNQIGLVQRCAETTLIIHCTVTYMVKNTGETRHLLKVSEPNPECIVNLQQQSTSEGTKIKPAVSTKSLYKSGNLATNSNVVITRSGRVSKPNSRYNDYFT